MNHNEMSVNAKTWMSSFSREESQSSHINTAIQRKIKDKINEMSLFYGGDEYYHEDMVTRKVEELQNWKSGLTSKELAKKIFGVLDFFEGTAYGIDFSAETFKETISKSAQSALEGVVPKELIERSINVYTDVKTKEFLARIKFGELLDNQYITDGEKVQFLKDNIDTLSTLSDKFKNSFKDISQYQKDFTKTWGKPISVMIFYATIKTPIGQVLLGGSAGTSIILNTMGEHGIQYARNIEEKLDNILVNIKKVAIKIKKNPGSFWKDINDVDVKEDVVDKVPNKNKPKF